MGSICPKQSKGKPDSMKNMGGNNSKVIKNGPPRKASKPPVVKALYDFNGMNDGDLAFKRGDRMTVLDKSDPDWWKAEKWDDQTTGFIPSNFVVEDNMTVEAQEWWFDMDRRSASVQLKCLTNDLGAFMVRKTEDNKTYAMSILVSRDANTKNIKHFRIKEENGKYFLTKSITFDDVIRLVEYYKLNPVPGDKYCLGKPCTREEKNVPFRSLEVDRKSIELMEKLGDGMFGKVVKGRFNKTQFVAVKMLKENSLMKKEGLEMEAMIMHRLKHPRIVQLMGICMQSEPYYIVTEYMSNGSLLTFLKSNNEFLEVGQLIDISSQIADGMSYLEKQDPPYIHRDLRAANCLVNENNIAKVADFGLAKMVDEGIYEGEKVNCKFPVKWTAREGLEAKVFTVKSDVWSFGILLYEIFTLGGTPYPGWDNNLIKTEVLRGYQLKLNHHTRIECPPEVNDYRMRCLSWEPEDRPSFAQLKQFFGSFNTDSYQAI